MRGWALALLGVAAAASPRGSGPLQSHRGRCGRGTLLFAPALQPARAPTGVKTPHGRLGQGAASYRAAGRMLAADDGKAERELKRAAAKLDPRFVDFVERTERTVEQLERAEVLLPTGFALDGAILRNQQGETVDPETLRGTSVGTTA
jgi:hypothetical protein